MPTGYYGFLIRLMYESSYFDVFIFILLLFYKITKLIHMWYNKKSKLSQTVGLKLVLKLSHAFYSYILFISEIFYILSVLKMPTCVPMWGYFRIFEMSVWIWIPLMVSNSLFSFNKLFNYYGWKQNKNWSHLIPQFTFPLMWIINV